MSLDSVDTTSQDPIPNVTLDQLNYFWSIDGLPVFYADRHNIEDIVEDLGFGIYYLICNIAEDKETQTTTYASGGYNYKTHNTPSINSASFPTTTKTIVTEKTTAIVKVVTNIIGRTVSRVDSEVADLAAVREVAEYNLPGMPLEIINRLDDFFRLVEAQHGTESIVLLTFDPSKKDSSGWGVLVPEQTNTSVHCNYNPDSIVEEKPENVLIVGSVHSHPNMSAYASGTDHSDQADFDGLHITYGWQKSVNGGATQYYIEMQMAGTAYVLKPEDVFEGYSTDRTPDETVVEWSTKVKKVQPPSGGSVFQTTNHNTPLLTNPNLTLSQQIKITESTPVGTTEFRLGKNVPEVMDKNPHIVVAEIDPRAKSLICPACEYTLSDYDLISGECPVCDIPIVSMEDDYKDVISKIQKYLSYRRIHDARTIYLWTNEPNGTVQLMKLSEYQVSAIDIKDSHVVVEEYSPFEASSDDEDDEINLSKDGFDPDLTLCCFRNLQECQCPKMVTYEELTDFEIDHRNRNIYSVDSACLNCRSQYTANCPAYYDAVIDYATKGIIQVSQITECTFFQAYDFEESYYNIKP